MKTGNLRVANQAHSQTTDGILASVKTTIRPKRKRTNLLTDLLSGAAWEACDQADLQDIFIPHAGQDFTECLEILRRAQRMAILRIWKREIPDMRPPRNRPLPRPLWSLHVGNQSKLHTALKYSAYRFLSRVFDDIALERDGPYGKADLCSLKGNLYVEVGNCPAYRGLCVLDGHRLGVIPYDMVNNFYVLWADLPTPERRWATPTPEAL